MKPKLNLTLNILSKLNSLVKSLSDKLRFKFLVSPPPDLEGIKMRRGVGLKNFFTSIRDSFKLRVIVFTVMIFIVGVAMSSIYLSQMLRKDMQRILGYQQAATVAQVAFEINTNFDERINALELVASGIDSSMLGNHAKLQAYLEQRPLLKTLFNAGVVIVGKNGNGLAETPFFGRIGTNYSDRDYVTIPLNEGKTVVGKTVVGKATGAPVFSIAAPIKDDQGKAIGVLSGAINLGKPNFLNGLNISGYGKTGGFIVLDPKHDQIVTASSSGFYKKLVMIPLPSREVNPLMYRRIEEGFDGTAVNVNSLGVEVMTSSARLPFPGWILIASLPTAEAFAPIVQTQNRILFATIFHRNWSNQRYRFGCS